jgi:hypothetical protein
MTLKNRVSDDQNREFRKRKIFRYFFIQFLCKKITDVLLSVITFASQKILRHAITFPN